MQKEKKQELELITGVTELEDEVLEAVTGGVISDTCASCTSGGGCNGGAGCGDGGPKQQL